MCWGAFNLDALIAGFLGLELQGELSVGDLIVGGGTLLLAYFTWSLAKQTQRDVEKTDKALELSRQGIAAQTESLDLTREQTAGQQESLRLAQEAIEVQDMPFVIASPNPKWEQIRLAPVDHGDWLMLFRLWNVGRGPAIVGDVQLDVDDQEILEPMVLQAPVAAGEARDINLMLVGPVSEEAAVGTLRVYYSHASGRRYVTTSEVAIKKGFLRCLSYSRGPSDDKERQGGLPLDL